MGKVTTYHKGNMLFESKLGNHAVVIDVPSGMGGSDRGPTPPELFIASLGSCVGAFVANYCHQTGIDTSDMSIDVTFDKVEDPTRLVNLKIDVNLPNAVYEKREKALLRVAEHCPVHETITAMDGIQINFNGHQK